MPHRRRDRVLENPKGTCFPRLVIPNPHVPIGLPPCSKLAIPQTFLPIFCSPIHTLARHRKDQQKLQLAIDRAEKMPMASSAQWTRLRTLGRGASGAEVFLAADDASGEQFAVKSACASGAAALRREHAVMAGLRSPRVVSCIGGRAGRDGTYQLFLEFAPGGSLADEVAKSGGLNEPTVRAYAADVARGLAYLHGEAMVHGDVKARNVVIGSDGRAKLADFGCARKFSTGGKMIGGTRQRLWRRRWHAGRNKARQQMSGHWAARWSRWPPAAPRGAAWTATRSRRCTVSGTPMLCPRKASDRCTAAQLLEHPFLASAVADVKLESMEGKWVSPKSTLDAALWESDSDSEEADNDELWHSTAERIKALACPATALPDWDSEDGWIDVLSAASTETQDAVALPAVETAADLHSTITREEASGAETVVPCISARRHHQSLEDLDCQELLCKPIFCSKSSAIDIVSVHKTLCSVLHLSFSAYIASSTLHCDTFDR
ncbi:hypothetical protein QYE76_015780 [Lolium multiflorum]|uniref:Protein kinase domain-containing protein n=1 Tax=Lolium multiflorum TaxID=4521 RepID=A0AAD8U723_LOLMU|nr:hypothetical protein QYE76_015780 [Lolium multiflorum]